jgi:hypothetical protein
VDLGQGDWEEIDRGRQSGGREVGDEAGRLGEEKWEEMMRQVDWEKTDWRKSSVRR